MGGGRGGAAPAGVSGAAFGKSPKATWLGGDVRGPRKRATAAARNKTPEKAPVPPINLSHFCWVLRSAETQKGGCLQSGVSEPRGKLFVQTLAPRTTFPFPRCRGTRSREQSAAANTSSEFKLCVIRLCVDYRISFSPMYTNDIVMQLFCVYYNLFSSTD